MKRVLPYLLFFVFVLGNYYFRRMTSRQKQWIKFTLGTLFIIGWVYLLIKFV